MSLQKPCKLRYMYMCAHKHNTLHLLLEVPYRKGISIREKMRDVVSDAIVLQVVHHVCAISLYRLWRWKVVSREEEVGIR